MGWLAGEMRNSAADPQPPAEGPARTPLAGGPAARPAGPRCGPGQAPQSPPGDRGKNDPPWKRIYAIQAHDPRRAAAGGVPLSLRSQMLTQLLGTAATVYGVLGALKTLLQTRQLLARRSSRDVSAGFLASYTGGYAIWLAYGLSTGSLPLIVVDTVGLLCAGLTIAVALSLRGSLIRPATWNSRNTTSISQRPAAPYRAPRDIDETIAL